MTIHGKLVHLGNKIVLKSKMVWSFTSKRREISGKLVHFGDKNILLNTLSKSQKMVGSVIFKMISLATIRGRLEHFEDKNTL